MHLTGPYEIFLPNPCCGQRWSTRRYYLELERPIGSTIRVILQLLHQKLILYPVRPPNGNWDRGIHGDARDDLDGLVEGMVVEVGPERHRFDSSRGIRSE